jgi:hypothetical protein
MNHVLTEGIPANHPDRKTMDQYTLLRMLLDDLEKIPDHEITDLVCGSHLVAVESRVTGLASRVDHDHCGSAQSPPIKCTFESAKKTAQLLLDGDLFHSSIGLASYNSLLPTPPADSLRAMKAQELILEYGEGKNVAVIGHFPFVEKMGSRFRRFWVLERNPKGDDLRAEHAQRVLPSADVVAITATTLANGTLAGILDLVPKHAFKILLGPSTPLTPALFRMGLDVLAGVLFEDSGQVKRRIRSGCRFKEMKGIAHVVMIL